MEFKIKAEDVKRDAEGRWGSILLRLAPALGPALERAGKHVQCPHPAHGGKGDFRLFKRNFEQTGGAICTCGAWADGISLLMWINGWDFKTALYEIAEELGYDVDSDQPRAVAPKVDLARLEAERKKKEAEEAERNKRVRAVLNRIWRESFPADSPISEPLRLYLARRGLATTQLPPTLRLHPNLAYHDEDQNLIGYWPALVAMVQTLDGKPVTLHRIYLTRDGRKAPVEEPKKLMPYPSDVPLIGSAIRLGAAGASLGISEGIETGLAVMQSTGLPIWVTITAKLMESVHIPEMVKMLCIYADKDRSQTGRNSAAILVQRMWQEGRQACGLLPTNAIPEAGKGIDWLDVLNIKGPQGIPNLTRVQQLLKKATVGK